MCEEIKNITVTQIKTFVYLYISKDIACRLLHPILNDFDVVIEVVFNELEGLNFHRFALRSSHGKDDAAINSKGIFILLGIDRSSLKKQPRFQKTQDIEVFESYVTLAGVLILKYIHQDIWTPKYLDVNVFVQEYLNKCSETVPDSSASIQDIFSELTTQSLCELMWFANSVCSISEYFSPERNKNRFLVMASCLSEGPLHRRYMTGGCPTKATASRVAVYHQETACGLTKKRRRGSESSISSTSSICRSMSCSDTEFNVDSNIDAFDVEDDSALKQILMLL